MLLAGCSGPSFDRSAVLPLVHDALAAQTREGDSPGVQERLRGLQDVALEGLSQVDTPLEAGGTASPLGRGSWDVTHRKDEEASWWVADRRITSQDEQGHWQVADQGILLRPDDARAVLLDDLGLFQSGRDTARMGRSVLVVLVDSKLMVVDLASWTCFLVP